MSRPSNRSITRRTLLTATGAVGVATLAGCMGNGNGDDDDSTGADGELAIVHHEFLPTDTDEDRFNGLIVGTVENDSGEDITDLTVRATLFDEDGNQGDINYVDSTSLLSDGDSWDFEIELPNEDEEFMDDYELELDYIG